MLEASEGQNSLAETSVRIQMAQADLATRDMLLQSALQQMEQTRLEANRQVRYLDDRRHASRKRGTVLSARI